LETSSRTSGAVPAPPSAAAAAAGPAWGRLAVPALLLVLTALAMQPLWEGGWYLNHEGGAPLERLLAIVHEMAGGDPYPRWLSAGYHGKGIPFLNYYSPAFYLVSGALTVAGVPPLLAMKLVIGLAFLGGALGTWLWVRRHLGPWGGVLAAVLYLYAPYHFVDLYVRGAMAEFAALALLPWVLLGVDRVVERPFSPGPLAALAAAAAGVVLTHHLSALLVLPMAAVYVGARAASQPRPWRAVAAVAASGGLGAALSAFYWLPALAERGALGDLAAGVTTGFYEYGQHFVWPRQWFDPRWGFGGSLPGPGDGMSFQIGLLHTLGAAAALLLARALPREARRFVLLSGALGAIALWLTTEASAPWYRLLSPYRYVQFPWRFLGPATLFLAAAAGGVGTRLAAAAGRLAPARRAVALGAAIAVLAVGAVLGSGKQRTVDGRFSIPGSEDGRRLAEGAAAARAVGGLAIMNEYLPRFASIEGARRIAGGPTPLASGAELSDVRAGTKRLEFLAVAGPDARVIVPWYWFPGWRLEIDGRPAPIGPGSEGLLAFEVPAGTHEVEVWFGTTAPRVIGWIVAALAAAGLAAAAMLGRARGRAPRRGT
jgi:hypothetical protein